MAPPQACIGIIGCQIVRQGPCQSVLVLTAFAVHLSLAALTQQDACVGQADSQSLVTTPKAEGRPFYMLALLHSARANLSQYPLCASHAVSECISLACLHRLHAAVDAA